MGTPKTAECQPDNLDQFTINVLKGLVIDGVHQAKSGHPGGPLSSMDFAYILFTEFLQFDPDDPNWLGRDRFVLSAGHESMLLYSFLHLMGWLKDSDLREFRQLHSRTPGHPEVAVTPGVECTTGPLGQGAGMTVGMAIAAAHFAATLDSQLFGYRVYALLGDGCIQEGITYASASLAGHLRLDNLVWYYDQNRKQISGDISRCYSDNVGQVFTGMGWRVEEIDGHDHKAIRAALKNAQTSDGRPTLIVGQTVMAKGTHSCEGDHEVHGAPLSGEERIKTKECLGLPLDVDFFCPEAAIEHFQRGFAAKMVAATRWRQHLDELLAGSKEVSDRFAAHFAIGDGKSRVPVPASLPKIAWPEAKPMATRNAFGTIIESWADALPSLMGGSADLEPSNMTGPFAKKVGDFAPGARHGRNLAFGVREFPMSCITNGMALHGGLIPFDATFLSFADYSRAALRLGAIQKLCVIHEFTHDSFYLGEDGPTHQPIEHIMSLRAMPGMYVMRPADPVETEVLMRKALTLSAPSSVCLTRQKVPYLPLKYEQVAAAGRGAYVVRPGTKAVPDLIIFATGSEVGLALETADNLRAVSVRVVSVPCWELFFAESVEYQKSVMTWECTRRVSIEAGATLGWERFTGHDGLNVGVDHFGESAPAEALAEAFGFTPARVTARVRERWVDLA